MFQSKIAGFRLNSFRAIVFCLALMGSVAIHLSPCLGADEESVKKAFEDFQKDWIVKLNQNSDYGEDKVKVEKDQTGAFRASYRIIGKETQSEVKATGDKTSPYVGILKYEEQTYVNSANTPELAKKGPFQCERRVLVTEVFRYSKGKWLY